jgi:hypothetical protein
MFPQSSDIVEDPLLIHLANQGEKFGEYCKRLFPHGVEIGSTSKVRPRGDEMTYQHGNTSLSLESLLAQTQQMLMTCPEKNNRITIFEGAICHESFYARPDILDMFINVDGELELRVIEVKSKSWDSRHTILDKMWTEKKTIRAAFLPYIQDVAFQTMVCRLVYPAIHISSWLMMPDRAKTLKCNNSLELTNDMRHTVDETMQAVDDSIASLVNVDELVEKALTDEVSYPGSNMNGEACDLQKQVKLWAEQLNSNNFDTLSPPIGTHCSSCEYRVKEPEEGTYSGFDICWEAATGLTKEELQHSPLVVDLYGNTTKEMTLFLSQAKYSLSDLTKCDFFGEHESSTMKKRFGGETIGKYERQWHYVETIQRNTSIHPPPAPKFIIRKGLKQIIGNWRYPLHFIDFETVAPVIPLYPHMSPYEVFAFQFSHHTLHQGSLEVQHSSEFLHTEQGSPIVSFLKALHAAICSNRDGGTVFQWSPHEHNVLKTMLTSPLALEALSTQEFADLTSLVENGMVDLCKLAQKYYYVDGSDGSSSIKKLLQPTLQISKKLKSIYNSPSYNSSNFTNFQWYQTADNGRVMDPYDILSTIADPDHQHGNANVTKGGAAAAAFHELQNDDLSVKDYTAMKNSLLRYCEVDTLAMVMIFQAWQDLLDDDDS